MVEVHVCQMRSEFDHIKQDMLDMKATAREQNFDVKEIIKEQGKDMLLMRDSHTETKIYIKQIQASQDAMSSENKASQKELKDNQALLMQGIQELKEEPAKAHKAKDMVVWTFAITWVLSNAFGLIKTFAPKLIGQ